MGWEALHLLGPTEHRLGLGSISLLHVNLGQQQIAVGKAGPPGEKILQSRGGILKVTLLLLVKGQGIGVLRLLGV